MTKMISDYRLESIDVTKRTQKTILVTGGAGFVGSHLCDRLLADGHSVICLDNFETGDIHNNAHQLRNPRFRLIRANVNDPIELGTRVDEIYNLACPASPVHYQKSPIKTYRTNVLGAMSVLDLALQDGARVLQASTSEIYGDPLVHPQVEGYFGNTNCFGERACYDEGKRGAETLFWSYASELGVDIRIARIFNTYGPRMREDDGRVVSNFIVQALEGRPITIYGDGEQTRSFCFVDDLVDGLVRLMAGDVKTPVNLGNPGEFTMKELADCVIGMTGSTSTIVHMPIPADDPQRRKPDISKANEALGWAPTIPLHIGLSRTIDYFRAIRASNDDLRNPFSSIGHLTVAE